MNLRRWIPIAAAIPLMACVDDGSAPEGAQLLAPERVEVNWDAAFDEIEDGVGAMVPVDLMVYEGATGEPLEGIDLAFERTNLDLVEASAIEVLSSDCSDCVWDAMRDRYVDWPASTLATQTDADGLARVYVWVDSFAGDAPFFEIEMGETLAQVDLLPE